MAIDLVNEQTFPLADAAKLMPHGRKGRPCHFTTVLRWVRDGAVGPTGKRVHLEAVRLGGRWVTSREALERFTARLTPAKGKAEQSGTKQNGSAGGVTGQRRKLGRGRR
jgi:hypothetical protein